MATQIRNKELTFVKLIAAIALVSIALLGAVAFSYNSMMCTRVADAHITAARVALTLVQGWSAAAGAATFDPVVAFDTGDLDDISIVSAGSGPDKPAAFWPLLGYYQIDTDDNEYFATLSYNNLPNELRALNVTISWDRRSFETGLGNANRSYTLTTYTKPPAP